VNQMHSFCGSATLLANAASISDCSIRTSKAELCGKMPPRHLFSCECVCAHQLIRGGKQLLFTMMLISANSMKVDKYCHSMVLIPLICCVTQSSYLGFMALYH
jgi:hypothetical protein